jgi:hypothetical protein
MNGGQNTYVVEAERLADGPAGVNLYNRRADNSGSGTPADPWALAAGAIDAPGTYLVPGYFALSETLLVRDLQDITIVGYGPRTGFRYAGTAGQPAVYVDGSTWTYDWTVDNAVVPFRVGIHNLKIDAAGLANDALRLHRVVHFQADDLVLRNATRACLRGEFGVGNVFNRLNCYHHGPDRTTDPQYGVWLKDEGDANLMTTATLFLGPRISRATVAGVYLDHAIFVTSVGGFVELCGGKGVLENAGCWANSFSDGFDVENCVGTDFDLSGRKTRLDCVVSTKDIILRAASKSVSVRDSRACAVAIEPGATDALIDSVDYGYTGQIGGGGDIVNGEPTARVVGCVKDTSGVSGVGGNRYPYAGPGSVLPRADDLVRRVCKPAVYWRFDDAVGSTTVRDHARGQTGTVVAGSGSLTFGGAPLVNGLPGGSATLTVGAYVKRAAPAGLDGGTTVCVGAVFKTTTAGAYQYFAAKDDDNANRGFGLRISNTNKVQGYVYIAGVEKSATGTTTVTDGVKSVAFLTHDGTTVRVYLARVVNHACVVTLEASTAAAGSTGSAGTVEFTAGANLGFDASVNFPFAGQLSDVFAGCDAAPTADALARVAAALLQES